MDTLQLADVKIKNIDYRKWVPIQGDLKSLSKKNYAKLKKSLQDKKAFVPVFVWEHEGEYKLLDGHQRQRVFLNESVQFKTDKDQLTYNYPCIMIEADNLKDAKEKLLIISSQYGTIEQEGFDEFIFDLDDEYLNDLIHFDAIKGVDLSDNSQEDEFKEGLPTIPITKRGDIYQLNEHKFICGDSTLQEDWKKLLVDWKLDLSVTDPPYNVDYTGKTKDKLKIENDRLEDDVFYNFILNAFSNMEAYSKKGAASYVFHADSEGDKFRMAFKEAGYKLAQCLIWKKQTIVLGRQDYHWLHEPILYGWKEGSKHNWYSDRKQSTILEYDRPTVSTEHPTMKPIALLSYLIGNNSKEGDIIGDCFLGAGSTIMACEMTDRICVGHELDPKYCDVIVRRWVTYMMENEKQFVVKKNGKDLPDSQLKKYA